MPIAKNLKINKFKVKLLYYDNNKFNHASNIDDDIHKLSCKTKTYQLHIIYIDK